MTALCDCCRRQVDVVEAAGLCFTCFLVATVMNIVVDETELDEGQAGALAKALLVPIFTAITQRLQVPGQEHPLALARERHLFAAPPIAQLNVAK
jgi:hypothetical protein